MLKLQRIFGHRLPFVCHEVPAEIASPPNKRLTSLRAYLGRVTKARILATVREALGDEATDRIAGLKKQAMAEAAEHLLAGTGWLPPLLRTERPAWLLDEQPEASAEAVGDEPFAVAAE